MCIYFARSLSLAEIRDYSQCARAQNAQKVSANQLMITAIFTTTFALIFHGALVVPLATFYLVCWPIRGIVVDKPYMIGHYLAGLHSKFRYYCELVDQK